MRLLSWSLLGKSSARTSVTSAQSRTIPAPGTYIHEQDHSPPSRNKPSHPQLLLPARHVALFFTAAGLRFFRWFAWDTSSCPRAALATPPGKRAAAVIWVSNTRSISSGGSANGTDQDLTQTQNCHFHSVIFNNPIPSLFHHAEQQMLLMLASLLREASVRRQLEINPYFSRVTKSRPWLLLLSAPL